jgi:hypothetical protein
VGVIGAFVCVKGVSVGVKGAFSGLAVSIINVGATGWLLGITGVLVVTCLFDGGDLTDVIVHLTG